MIKFVEKTHSYTSGDEKWTSATSLIGRYKQPFDADSVAKKASKNKKSKWFGLDPEVIKSIWNGERDRANTLGTFYHNQREDDVLSCASIERHGKVLPVFACKFSEDGTKLSSDQKLEEGVYPEHLVYLNSHKIAGQSDLVEVADGKVHITDYKTNKEIKQNSFVNWKGESQKMKSPVFHIDDSNYWHYSLQLSLYMYIILKHNPQLKPGKLILQHVIFEQEGEDEYGYPKYVYKNGEPVVKGTVIYTVPYLKKEIMSILKDYGKNL